MPHRNIGDWLQTSIEMPAQIEVAHLVGLADALLQGVQRTSIESILNAFWTLGKKTSHFRPDAIIVA
jgi:hypothetical protein